jgi:hypothetical protein
MMKLKAALLGVTAVTALAVAPLAPASARDWGWHTGPSIGSFHGGWHPGPSTAAWHGGWHEGWRGGGWGWHNDVGFGLIGATLGAAAALATAPFALAADMTAPAAPVYEAPAAYPVYAAPPVYPGYAYARPHRIVYAAPARAYYGY